MKNLLKSLTNKEKMNNLKAEYTVTLRDGVNVRKATYKCYSSVEAVKLAKREFGVSEIGRVDLAV